MAGLHMPVMLKAALPMVPLVNQLPGIRKRGGDLPDITRTREGVRIDPDHVVSYAAVCGFEPSDKLPLTYPHVLAFPLHMDIMTSPEFPYPAIGTVHVRNRIHQFRAIAPSENLDVEVTATNLRLHPKGKVFDMNAVVSSAGETVWESTSTYLRFGKPNPEAPTDGESFELAVPEEPRDEAPRRIPSGGIEWKLPGNLGRTYGAVSGDLNPIHLYPVTAKALGFKRQIAHGMWTKARCVAAVANRVGEEATVEVEFKKPVFLPGRVTFACRVRPGTSGAGIDFALTNPKDGAPHLVGRTR